MRDPVCILAAGSGSRMGDFGGWIHKGLLPIENQAILSRIVNAFGIGRRYVIAAGALRDQIANYLGLAHPGLDCDWVSVSNSHPAGPGVSALLCAKKLGGPFYLACTDQVWSHDFQFPSKSRENLLYTAPVPASLSADYCTAEIRGGRVTGFRDKELIAHRPRAFTGLAHIGDVQRFYSGIRAAIQADPTREIQLASGFEAILGRKFLAQNLPGWTDLGTQEKYAQVTSASEGPRVKRNQFTYFVGKRVVKFFADPRIAENRCASARLTSPLFAPVSGYAGQFMATHYIEGSPFYDRMDPSLLEDLLVEFKRDLWFSKSAGPDFAGSQRRFYLDRTRMRLGEYLSHSATDSRDRAQADEVSDLLAGLDFITGESTFIHGDLQIDNIIIPTDRQDGRVKLIDWRDSFDDRLDCGDIYYDFAKLHASLSLDFRALAAGNDVRADPRRVACLEILRGFVERNGYRWDLVESRSALVLLNMAGLHQAPFARVLFEAGASRLRECIDRRPLARARLA